MREAKTVRCDENALEEDLEHITEKGKMGEGGQRGRAVRKKKTVESENKKTEEGCLGGSGR